jgi:drug/metabolite transporter (DMT)-like permease
MEVTKSPIIPHASTLVAIRLGRLALGEELTPSGTMGTAAILSGILLAQLGFLMSKRRTS